MRALTTALLTLSFLISPFTASAQTLEQLQAQLSILLQQLQTVQGGQPAQTAIGYGTVNSLYGGGLQCVSITRNLGPGMSGSDVTQLQRFLAQNPAWYPEAQVTGYYGALTTRAVQRFQIEKGLIAYGDPSSTGFGAVGPRTRQAMANCGSGPIISPPIYPYYPPTPVPPTPTTPLTGPITVNIGNNQFYEARGNGFYIKMLSIGNSSAFVEFGVPMCGNPGWPSEIVYTGGYTCMAIGERRQVTLTVGSTVNIPKGSETIGLKLESITNGVAYITITPNVTSITCSVTANKSNIAMNELVTVTWSSSGALSAKWTSGPFSGSGVGTVGSVSMNTLTSSQNLSIEFTGSGGTRTCSVYVGVTSNPSISLTLPVSGYLIARGQPLGIAWNSQYAPTDSKVRLEIYRSNQSTVTGNNDNGIVTAGPTTGSYQWTIPTPTSPILADSGLISGLPDGQYRIVAKLYTGSECWGYCASSSRTILSTTETGLFTIGTTTSATSTSFSANVTSGRAPLSVTFSTWFSVNRPVNPVYFIDFGDGQSANVPNCVLGSNGCTSAGTIAHTYASVGTYTARLIQRATGANSTYVDTVLSSITINATACDAAGVGQGGSNNGC